MEVEGDPAGWEERLAKAWASIDERSEAEFLATIDALASELPRGSALGIFERAGSLDSTGHPDLAVPLYQQALALGLTGGRRRRAVIQLASSLRNLGQPEQSVELLRAELEAGSDDLDDGVRAFLALALADTGREREAVSIALTALASHLPRYQRSLANYAREINVIPSRVLAESLSRALEATRQRESSLRELVTNARAPVDRWSAKDNLAHLAAWRGHAADVLEAARDGREVADISDEHARNAETYARDAHKTAAQVLAEADASWERLKRTLAHLDDSLLQSARPNRPGHQLWEIIPGNTYHHLAEHLGYFHGEQGNREFADEAQEWACGLAQGVTEDRRPRAIALYNLACYYARRGDGNQAIPRLQAAVALDSSVSEWADGDEDLVPIHGDPRLRAVLEVPNPR